MSERNYNAMDGEQKFYLGIMALIVFAVCTLIVSIATYNINQNQTIKQLVDKGVDPLSAGCTFDVRATSCAARIAK